MVINQDDVFSDTKLVFLNWLKDSSNGLTDLQSPARSRSKWILTHFPNRESGTKSMRAFTGYPLVIVSSVPVSQSNKSFEKYSRNGTITISVCHEGTTTDFETLCNECLKRLQAGMSTFRSEGLAKINLTSSDVPSSPLFSSNYHQRNFVLSFVFKEWVS